jgi:hypothetical protein
MEARPAAQSRSATDYSCTATEPALHVRAEIRSQSSYSFFAEMAHAKLGPCPICVTDEF